MARKGANDRDFLNGFFLGHVAGRIEAARELEAEFRNELERTRADALKIINEVRADWWACRPLRKTWTARL